MKKNISIILSIIIFLILTSCSGGSYVNNNINEKIQLWSYIDESDVSNKNCVLKIVEIATEFCKKNNIPLETYVFSSKEISLEDYILKRNVAAASGNLISIDSREILHDIALQHADYTKLANYDKLLDIYKKEFYIPLGTYNIFHSIDNDMLQFYNISTDKKIITFHEYLDIKQEMKEKGAKFELNYYEFYEIINNYLYKNEILFLNEKSEIIKDKSKFSKSLKTTVLNLCSDIQLYYDKSSLQTISEIGYLGKTNDLNSGMQLIYGFSYRDFLFPHSQIKSSMIDGRNMFYNKIFYYDPFVMSYSPTFFMYKKITNDKIYDLANYIVSEETYVMLFSELALSYAPVFKIEKARTVLLLNNENKFKENIISLSDFNNMKPEERAGYIGMQTIYDMDVMRELINTRYDMLLNDKEAGAEFKNAYFFNSDYKYIISKFVEELIYDVARKLSGDYLSLEKFNPKDLETNKLIDEKIKEFVANFNIHYN